MNEKVERIFRKGHTKEESLTLLFDELQKDHSLNEVKFGKLKYGFYPGGGAGASSSRNILVFTKRMMKWDIDRILLMVIHEYSHLLRMNNIGTKWEFVKLAMTKGGHDAKWRKIEQEILLEYGITVQYGWTYEKEAYREGEKFRGRFFDRTAKLAFIASIATFLIAIVSSTIYMQSRGWGDLSNTIIQTIMLGSFGVMVLMNLSEGWMMQYYHNKIKKKEAI
jgi:hypothetical protein